MKAGRPVPSSSGIFLLFLAGAAVGAAVTYLTTPRSGRENRDRLKEFAGDAAESARRLTPALREAYARAAEAAKEAFAQALEGRDEEPVVKETLH